MWSWDQGRLDYFQFDNLKKIARFALDNDLRQTDHAPLIEATGLPFSPQDKGYMPWRNYRRVFELSMICVAQEQGSRTTPIAELLASDGDITTDEYFHFLAQATTDPSPALQGWNHLAPMRYPLLFCLKFLLARCAIEESVSDISDIIAAYDASNFVGTENQTEFISLIRESNEISAQVRNSNKYRQPRESIRVLAQISYLSLDRNTMTVSLTAEDAGNLFDQLTTIPGKSASDGGEEIIRITSFFRSTVAGLDLNYPTTAIDDIEDSGFSSKITFAEGAKTRRTHLVTERNSKIRTAFFEANPTAVCDFCSMDTKKRYPWTKRILDIHHLLPLCSGTRTSDQGTLLSDLVAVCPTCHRGVHRFYDKWLKDSGQKDFSGADQAREVYGYAKQNYRGA